MGPVSRQTPKDARNEGRVSFDRMFRPFDPNEQRRPPPPGEKGGKEKDEFGPSFDRMNQMIAEMNRSSAELFTKTTRPPAPGTTKANPTSFSSSTSTPSIGSRPNTNRTSPSNSSDAWYKSDDLGSRRSNEQSRNSGANTSGSSSSGTSRK